MNQAIIEGLKQVGRVIVVAILPILITSLQASTFDWKSTGIAVAVAALMGIDKWVHTTDLTSLNGIVPF
jgi:hypothetical protein